MHDITVELGERSYKIHIGENLAGTLLALADEFVSENRPVAVITCPTLPQLHPQLFAELKKRSSLLIETSVDGEGAKSTRELADTWEKLAQARIDRSGVIFAVGGGVVGDLSGFCAATFLRGITFVQVPTTLLSMVDSSVGGKTGINLPSGKNLVGAFHQPVAVVADMALLSTLPPREFAAGMAEVIKYGMLGDASFFEKLEATGTLAWDSRELPAVVRRCCEIKAQVVAADERETAKENGRALLNLGHTFGHAIEKVAGYGEYLHGEAVAVGCVAAAMLSENLGFAPTGTLTARTIALCEKNNLPVKLRTPLSLDALVAAGGNDKKVVAGKLRFVLMKKIGEAFTTSDVPVDAVREVWLALGAK
ncbi:MAG: 3-dehydroquinate synthase [Opitutales bacterium]|nr:3-dehydroquinate synthase [Opitutales bacterium]